MRCARLFVYSFNFVIINRFLIYFWILLSGECFCWCATCVCRSKSVIEIDAIWWESSREIIYFFRRRAMECELPQIIKKVKLAFRLLECSYWTKYWRSFRSKIEFLLSWARGHWLCRYADAAVWISPAANCTPRKKCAHRSYGISMPRNNCSTRDMNFRWSDFIAAVN